MNDDVVSALTVGELARMLSTQGNSDTGYFQQLYRSVCVGVWKLCENYTCRAVYFYILTSFLLFICLIFPFLSFFCLLLFLFLFLFTVFFFFYVILSLLSLLFLFVSFFFVFRNHLFNLILLSLLQALRR